MTFTVRRGIETCGGSGEALVKGVVTRLSAIAVSIKPGGLVRRLTVNGGLLTHGDGVHAMELHGAIASLQISKSLGPSAADSLGSSDQRQHQT